jgi:hypothetical protein
MRFTEDKTEPKCLECLERAQVTVLPDLTHCTHGTKVLQVLKARLTSFRLRELISRFMGLTGLEQTGPRLVGHS